MRPCAVGASKLDGQVEPKPSLFGEGAKCGLSQHFWVVLKFYIRTEHVSNSQMITQEHLKTLNSDSVYCDTDFYCSATCKFDFSGEIFNNILWRPGPAGGAYSSPQMF